MLAKYMLSLSVHLSVKIWSSTKTAEPRIMQTTPYDRLAQGL